MTRPNRLLAIRGVKEQGTFAHPASEVMRQILGDEADPIVAQDVTADDQVAASRETTETAGSEIDERANTTVGLGKSYAEVPPSAPVEARGKTAVEDAKHSAQRAVEGDEKTPEQLAELRRSGSRQAVYKRKKDNRGMVKVGFSATRAFDLRLQEFTALLVDDTRNEWLMRTLDDAMNDQRERLIARRKRIHDLAQRGG